MVLVLIDCFTRFGGNHINSSATGRYEDYIINEIVPFVDKNYNISEHAVWGESSGGHGAIVLGMRHPEIFHAVADHSGVVGGMQPLNTVTSLIFQKHHLMHLERQADPRNGWITSGKKPIAMKKRWASSECVRDGCALLTQSKIEGNGCRFTF